MCWVINTVKWRIHNEVICHMMTLILKIGITKDYRITTMYNYYIAVFSYSLGMHKTTMQRKQHNHSKRRPSNHEQGLTHH